MLVVLLAITMFRNELCVGKQGSGYARLGKQYTEIACKVSSGAGVVRTGRYSQGLHSCLCWVLFKRDGDAG